MRTEIAIAVDKWHEEMLKSVCTYPFTFILISPNIVFKIQLGGTCLLTCFAELTDEGNMETINSVHKSSEANTTDNIIAVNSNTCSRTYIDSQSPHTR